MFIKDIFYERVIHIFGYEYSRIRARRIEKKEIYAYLVRRKVLPDSRIFSSLSNNVRTTLVRATSSYVVHNIYNIILGN